MDSVTPEQQAQQYESVPWKRRAPVTTGAGEWKTGWVVLLSDGRHAILERHRRQHFGYDLLRFSGYAFTDWTAGDPQRHLDFGSFLANEYQASGEVTEMSDGMFVFRTAPHRGAVAVELVGEALRPLTWIERSSRLPSARSLAMR